MDPVVHFELPGEDRARMSAFYERVFGWQTQQLGPEMGDYVLATTSETDENRMVKAPGTINGGFFQKTGPDDRASVTVAVDDIRATMQAVRDAGGAVLPSMMNAGEPDEIPGVGLFARILDTEGNTIGLLQPTNM